MTLPTGTISAADINAELGRSSTAEFSWNDSEGRILASVGGTGQNTSSGTQIDVDKFRGHARNFVSVNADTTNVTVSGLLTGNYVSGKTWGRITVGSGIVIGSTSVGAYALNVDGASGDRIEIVNNGYIVGMGGKGGRGDGGSGYNRGSASPGTDGEAGGPAIYAGYTTIITNNGIIGGGGGGGGGGGPGGNSGGKSRGPVPSGSGGGGAGRNVGAGGDAPIASEGTRTPGSDGTLLTGGAPSTNSGSGGAGGNLGQAGASPYRAGGAAGYYVVGGGNVTWSTLGDVRGSAG